MLEANKATKINPDYIAEKQQEVDDARAKLELQNVKNLNDLMAYAEKLMVDGDKYTVSTFESFSDVYNEIKRLDINSLTEEQLVGYTNKLNDAIKGLEYRVKQEVVDKYMNSVTFVENNNTYTTESYDAYKAAYDNLMSVTKNLSDVTEKQFFEAYNAYEEALKGLKKVVKPVEPTTPTTPTTPSKPTNKPVANGNGGYDDGGPFTTDKCGSIYDRWGNLMWKAPACNASVNDGYNIVNTGDR